MDCFVDDDPGYLDWVARQPDGFVINTGRTPTASYLMLHRADCGTITGRPAQGSTFTGDYAKVCGGRAELDGFARQLGAQARLCGLCLGQPARTQARIFGDGKYRPLRDHLSGQVSSRVRMTFAEMQDLVGPLPDSAHRHRAWWGNNGSSSQAQAWLDVGWHVESVNQAAGEVIFARGAGNLSRRPRHTAADGPSPYIDPQVSISLAVRATDLGLDPGKLARLVVELNDNYSRGNAYAAHALLRAVLDHIPPLLGCADFKAAASSYPWGRTDKTYARRLLDFKLQADDALHRQISKKTDWLGIDDMPPRTWINRILQECADSQRGNLMHS